MTEETRGHFPTFNLRIVKASIVDDHCLVSYSMHGGTRKHFKLQQYWDTHFQNEKGEWRDIQFVEHR